MINGSFRWATGLAEITAPFPPGMAGPDALKRFFIDPNNVGWTKGIARVLYHESVHAWQLASSSWLCGMVAEEWARVETMAATGAPPPPGRLRPSFGRVQPGDPFAVQELVESLARFWDVHTRSPRRILEEEGDDLGGELALLKARDGRYGNKEYDALMSEGREGAVYAMPYRWLLARMGDDESLRQMASRMGVSIGVIASWCAHVTLPLAGFLALNTERPAAAFAAAVDVIIQEGWLIEATTKRDARHRSINLDWLHFVPTMAERLLPMLRGRGFAVTLPQAAWAQLATHPVWRHLPQRWDALIEHIEWDLRQGTPPEAEPTPSSQEARRVERPVFQRAPWMVFALCGHWTCRWYLGTCVPPPLVRFRDVSLVATEAARNSSPWPVEAAELLAAVDRAERLHLPLRCQDRFRSLGIQHQH